MLDLIKQITFIFTDIYALCLMAILVGLSRLYVGINEKKHTISIVVAARNEAENIADCIEALLAQDYPSDKYEIIVVDDRSEDRTAEIVKKYAESHENLRLLQVPPDDPQEPLVGKKNAINMAIESSENELIFTTDADCIAPKTWLKGMNKHFEPDIGLVAGYLYTEKAGEDVPLWRKFRALERISIATVAAGTMSLNVGITGSAGNLAYRRKAFIDADGYRGIGHLRSGDDDLFIQKVHRNTEWQFRYSAMPETHVKTQPPESMTQAYQQEKRRASKGFKYHKWLIFLLIIVFLLNLSFAVFIPLSLFNFDKFGVVVWYFVIKAFFEMFVIYKGCLIFQRKDLFPLFFLAELLYIPYFLIFAILGTFRKYRWK